MEASARAVEVEGVAVSFGETRALAGVDLTVRDRHRPRPARPERRGQDDRVRILATLLRPTPARAASPATTSCATPTPVRALIGLTGQYAAVDDALTGRENLVLFGRLYRLNRAGRGARAAELLERFDLADAADRVVRTYSGGMRRRLDLAREPHRRARGALPRRAHHRPRPAQPRSSMWDFIDELVAERHDHAAHHAVPRGGRPARPPHRRHRPRPRDRRRHAERAEAAVGGDALDRAPPTRRAGRVVGRCAASRRRAALDDGDRRITLPVHEGATDAARTPCADSTRRTSSSTTSVCGGRRSTTCSSRSPGTAPHQPKATGTAWYAARAGRVGAA